MTRFAFDFSTPLSWPLRLLGVSPWTAHVDVDKGEFSVRYGPWSLRTPVANIASVRVTGPYHPLRSVGVHISLTDRGVTFGTTPRRGVCLTFRKPVAAALPAGLVTHPGVTVTVEDVDGLYELLQHEVASSPSDGATVQRITVPRRSVSPSAASAPPRVATPPPRPARRARRSNIEATPADMPQHTTIRKLPGTDVDDEGLPPSDAEIAARASAGEDGPRRTPVKRSAIKKSTSRRTASSGVSGADEPGAGLEAGAASDAAGAVSSPTTTADRPADRPVDEPAQERAGKPAAKPAKRASKKAAAQETPAPKRSGGKKPDAAGSRKRSGGRVDATPGIAGQAGGDGSPSGSPSDSGGSQQ